VGIGESTLAGEEESHISVTEFGERSVEKRREIERGGMFYTTRGPPSHT